MGGGHINFSCAGVDGEEICGGHQFISGLQGISVRWDGWGGGVVLHGVCKGIS